jgi:hypothetical protein
VRNNRLRLFFVVGLFFVLAGGVALADTIYHPPTVGFRPGWPVSVGKLVDRSSPAVGNLDGDSDLEIVVGTAGMEVHAFNPDGSRVAGWPVAVGAQVNSSPAIGDINGDGLNEVIIGVGWEDRENDGGIFAFSHDGKVLPGWPVRTMDRNLGPDGHSDGVFGTPALVDLDGDGLLDVVVASFDENLYGLRYDGTAARGWPFHLWDGTWSSPAVGDLDGDGSVEIVAAGYTHAGFPPGYPTVNGGGIIWVLDTKGNELPGWPQVFDLHFDSSPALGDLDGDGDLEIVIGTGHEPGTARGHKVYAFHHNGNLVNGWPAATSDYVWPSPALADLDGDGKDEVIVSCIDGKLYAWDDDGTTFPGRWPVRPINDAGLNGGMVGSPVVADLDNNTDLEIIVPIGWDLVGFNHDGSFFAYGNEEQLRMHTSFSLGGTPAIADVDHNNRLDVIMGSAVFEFDKGLLYVWELPEKAIPGEMPWPMWRQNPTRTGRASSAPFLAVTPASLLSLQPYGDEANPPFFLILENKGDGELAYSVQPDHNRVSVSPRSGSISDHKVAVKAEIDTRGLGPGTYHLGNLTVNGMVESEHVNGSPVIVPVTLYVGNVSRVFLPSIDE